MKRIAGGLVAVFAGHFAYAQNVPESAAPAYKDTYLSKETATEQAIDNRARNAKKFEGPYRSYFIEIGQGSTTGGSTQQNVIAGIQVEFPNYGVWSVNVQGETRSEGRSTNPRWKLEGFDIPLQDKWLAYVGLGYVQPRHTPILENGSRFYLPSYAVRGGVLRLNHEKDGVLHVYAGTPGSSAVFSQESSNSGGSIKGFGVEKKVFNEKITASLQGIMADLPENGPTNKIEENAAVAGAMRYQNGNVTGQVTGVLSTSLQGEGAAFWGDVSLRQHSSVYRGGLFGFTKNAYWGYQLVGSESYGGFASVDYNTRRLNYGISGEYVKTPTNESIYSGSYGRYQLDSYWSISGGSQVRLDNGKSSNAWNAAVDYRLNSGPLQVRLDRYNNRENSAYMVSMDKSWTTRFGSVGTNVGIGRVEYRPLNTHGPLRSAGLNYQFQLNETWSVGSSVRYQEQLQGSSSSKGTNTQLNLSGYLGSGWTVNGTVNWYKNANTTTIPVLSPISSLVVQPVVAEQTQRSVWVTLRWQDSRGSRGPVSGSGSIHGLIYMDANNNMRYDAGEPVAINVTVMLNNRFISITDKNGEFKFYSVPAGDHWVTVLADKIPLPWALEDDSPYKVNVQIRQVSNLKVPLRKW